MEPGTSGCHAPRALDELHAKIGVFGGAGGVVEARNSRRLPRVGGSIVPDLLERRIEEPVEVDPGHEAADCGGA